MRKLWEVTVILINQKKTTLRFYAPSSKILIQQLLRKRGDLLEHASSLEWKEII
ncbi:hypothetical protein [Ammoniphilus sp. 3BR4]|uniref:hypothetical protein n=1 Tax=Ammoniphilus sp. 3BR4 TaxID=3158265 RepID=UPI003467E4BC